MDIKSQLARYKSNTLELTPEQLQARAAALGRQYAQHGSDVGVMGRALLELEEPWRRRFTYTLWVGSPEMREFLASIESNEALVKGRQLVWLDRMLPNSIYDRDETRLQQLVMAHFRAERAKPTAPEETEACKP